MCKNISSTREGNHVNGFWLYFMACCCSCSCYQGCQGCCQGCCCWCCFAFANAVHGCIINYAYQSTEKGVNFCRWPATVPFPYPPTSSPHSSLSNEVQRGREEGVQLIWVHSTGNKYEVLNTRYAHFSAAKLLPQQQQQSRAERSAL